MIQPNIKFAKILFNSILILSLIAPIIIYLAYKDISSRCGKSVSFEKKEDTNTGVKKTIRNIIIISVLAGLTAQVMNYSFSFMKLRPATS